MCGFRGCADAIWCRSFTLLSQAASDRAIRSRVLSSLRGVLVLGSELVEWPGKKDAWREIIAMGSSAASK